MTALPTGPELDLEVARAMGLEVELTEIDWDDSDNPTSACILVEPRGLDASFKIWEPHRDMNDVRKMWDWMYKLSTCSDISYRYEDELVKLMHGDESEPNKCEWLCTATPEQHCQAFILAIREVG